MPSITKNLFLSTLACPTYGWLQHNQPIEEPTSPSSQLRIDEGVEVQERARKLFPDGLMVSGSNETCINRTKELLSKPEVSIIFEATFQNGHFITKADILIRTGSKWKMIEIKSAVNQSVDHVNDMAYTTFVALQAGLEMSSCSLMLVNKDYRLGMPDDNLLVEIDLSTEVSVRANEFCELSDGIAQVLSSEEQPAPELRWECKHCEMFSECCGAGINNHIFDLPRISHTKFCQLRDMGVDSIEEIPADFELTEMQGRVRDAVIAGEPYVDHQGLREAFESIVQPVYYLDFKTTQTAIPLYEGIAPYSQLVTQYSLHVKSGVVVDHCEYLAQADRDCRRDLAERLIGDCGSDGSIIVYSSFEKTVINGLADLFPDIADDLGKLGKEWDNFKPSHIDKYNLIEQSYFVGNRSPALKSGLYDLSYQGGKKYQTWSEQFGKALLRCMKPGSHLACFCSPRMYHRLCCGLEDAGWQVRTTLVWVFGTGFPTSTSISQQIDKMNGKKGKVICENPNRKGRLNWDKNDKDIIAPETPEADNWDGWYNNIKSSFEPILLARKPLSEKTLAENVLKWGTGGLNIDACRIPNSDNNPLTSKGRFPANVMLSEEASEELNRQAGHNVSSYFYCPKPSLSERNFGCEDLPPKKQNSDGKGRTYNDRCGNCGKKFIGPKTRICQCPIGEKITDKDVYTNPNNHPTIKPVSLLQQLSLLICPPGGTVIDCFGGSGTTGMACAYNNFKFIFIEKEKDYYQIARRRIMAAYRKKHQR